MANLFQKYFPKYYGECKTDYHRGRLGELLAKDKLEDWDLWYHVNGCFEYEKSDREILDIAHTIKEKHQNDFKYIDVVNSDFPKWAESRCLRSGLKRAIFCQKNNSWDEELQRYCKEVDTDKEIRECM